MEVERSPALLTKDDLKELYTGIETMTDIKKSLDKVKDKEIISQISRDIFEKAFQKANEKDIQGEPKLKRPEVPEKE